MKKYFSLAIFTIMMSAPMFLSSCGEDELISDDSQEQVMMEWTEPFHAKDSSVEEVKAFMASSLANRRFNVALSTFTSNALSQRRASSVAVVPDIAISRMPAASICFMLDPS